MKTLSGIVCLILWIAIPLHGEERLIRQRVAPTWHEDITHLAVRDDGLTFSQVFDRNRKSPIDEIGKDRTWTVTVEVPAKSEPYGVVLEVDGGSALSSVKINREEVSSLSIGGTWEGMERIWFFPEIALGKSVSIEFVARDLRSYYRNAFGRIRLRPARLAEVVHVEKLDGARKLRLHNRSDATLNLVFQAESTDYFQSPIKTFRKEITLSPRQKSDIEPELPPKRWKTVFRLEDEKEKSHPYLDYADPNIWNVNRPEVLRVDKGWERAYGGEGVELGPIPETDWEKVSGATVGYDRKKSKSHFMWVRTKIRIPSEWEHHCFYLEIPAVRWKVDVFVDGKHLGVKRLWETPARLALPKTLRPGDTFELAIGITDFIEALLPGTKIPEPGTYTAPPKSLITAVGHFPGDGNPRLSCNPELLGLPIAHVSSTAIRTSVKEGGEIVIDAKIENTANKPGNISLLVEIYRKGEKVFEFPVQPLTLQPGDNAVTLKKKWSDALRWSPDTPNLYELRLTIKNRGDKVLDVYRERFGFREIEIDGSHFTLNGERFHFNGFSHTMVGQQLWPFQGNPQTLIRHRFHDAAEFISGIGENHMADELGICIKGENLSHNAHGGERFAYQDTRIFDNLYEEFYNVWKLRANHPSIVFWDIGNEVSFRGPGEAERMGELMERINQFDPTRPVTVSGSHPFPLGPGAKILDVHGGCEPNLETYWFMHPEKRPYYRKDYVFYVRIPDGESPSVWTESRDGRPKPLQHAGNRPVLFSETMYTHGEAKPGLGGESTYFPFGKNDHEYLQHRLVRKHMIRFARKAGVASFLGHVSMGVTHSLFPIALFPADYRFRFVEKEPIVLKYELFNSSMLAENIEIGLTLKENDRIIARKTIRKTDVVPGAQEEIRFEFDPLETTGKDRRLDVLIDVRADSGAWYHDWDEVSVFVQPDWKIAEGKTLRLYDPKNTVNEFLQSRQVAFESIDRLTQWFGENDEILLVGADALTTEDFPLLRSKLETGGRVLVLDHRSVPDFTSLQLEVAEGEELSHDAVAFDTYGNGILKGLTSEDLRFWNTMDEDLLVCFKGVRLPRRGNFRIYTRSGSGIKPEESGLIEAAVGAGSVVFVQMNLSRTLGHDPAADRLLSNLLSEPGGFEYRPSAVIGRDVFVNALLGKTGLTATRLEDTKSLDRYYVLILDAEKLSTISHEDLRNWVRHGGTVFLPNIHSKNKEAIDSLLESEIRIDEAAHDRAYLLGNFDILAGLSHGDFFWTAGKLTIENRHVTARDLSKTQAPASNHTGHFVLAGETITPWLYPAYLSEAKMGKGRIVLSTLRLLDYPVSETGRILSTMATNLGVRLQPGSTISLDPDKIASQYRYEPIALNKTSENIEPLAGFEDLPEGLRQWKGVLFDPGDSKNGRGKTMLSLDKEVKDIPVKRRVERLAFLYGSSDGARGFTIRVWYEERKDWIPGMVNPYIDIPIRSGVDTVDCKKIETVLAGKVYLPRARLAWTDPSEKTGLLLFEWENPHPDKTIDAIDFLPADKEPGHAFLAAVSAGQMNSSGNEASVDLAEIAPGVKPADVAFRFENGVYGIIMLKNGRIPSIYSVRSKKRLFELERWSFHAGGKDLSTQNELKDVHVERRGNVFRFVQGKDKFSEPSLVVTCEPTSVRMDYEWNLTEELPPGILILAPLRFHNGKERAMVNQNPIMFDFESLGVGSLKYSNRLTSWHSGYWSQDNLIMFSVQYGMEMKKGNKVPFNLTIDIP